jgi:hypothetical protein
MLPLAKEDAGGCCGQTGDPGNDGGCVAVGCASTGDGVEDNGLAGALGAVPEKLFVGALGCIPKGLGITGLGVGAGPNGLNIVMRGLREIVDQRFAVDLVAHVSAEGLTWVWWRNRCTHNTYSKSSINGSPSIL